MTYHCQFCWCKVHPDGCGFFHANKTCPFEQAIENKNEPWWLGNSGVFSTKAADYMTPCYSKATPLKELGV